MPTRPAPSPAAQPCPNERREDTPSLTYARLPSLAQVVRNDLGDLRPKIHELDEMIVAAGRQGDLARRRCALMEYDAGTVRLHLLPFNNTVQVDHFTDPDRVIYPAVLRLRQATLSSPDRSGHSKGRA
jgi:hypothetical protein